MVLTFLISRIAFCTTASVFIEFDYILIADVLQSNSILIRSNILPDVVKTGTRVLEPSVDARHFREIEMNPLTNFRN